MLLLVVDPCGSRIESTRSPRRTLLWLYAFDRSPRLTRCRRVRLNCGLLELGRACANHYGQRQIHPRRFRPQLCHLNSEVTHRNGFPASTSKCDHGRATGARRSEADDLPIRTKKCGSRSTRLNHAVGEDFYASRVEGSAERRTLRLQTDGSYLFSGQVQMIHIALKVQVGAIGTIHPGAIGAGNVA